MALRHLLYRCPACGRDPVQGEGEAVTCTACGARFTRGAGARIRVEGSDRWSGEVAPAVLVDRIEELGGPFSVAGRPDGCFRYEAPARMRWVVAETPVRDRGTVLGFVERFGPETEGRLGVTADAVWFRGAAGDAGFEWPLLELRSIQGASSTLQLRSRADGVAHLAFPGDSPVRWETLLRGLVRDAWREQGRREIAEFQPRICGERRCDAPSRHLLERIAGGGSGRPSAAERFRGPLWYVPVITLLRLFTRLRLDLEVEGRGRIPRQGPFLLLANHESILDPLVIQVSCPRPVHSMTKSTQFRSWWCRAILPRMLAFPARRYRVDPQAVRTVLRLLAAGRGVCLYPEGERSWDGRPQPFRRGALRVARAAGVPVVPCAVSGSYDALPRWSRRLGRTRIRVRFGEPLDLGGEGGASLEEVEKRLRSALEDLGAAGAP